MICCISLLWGVLLFPAQWQEDIIVVSDGYVDVRALTDAQSFTPDQIQAESLRILSRYAEKPFVRIELGIKSEFTHYLGKGVVELSPENYFYRLRVELNNKLPKELYKCSLVLKVGSRAYLMSRFGDHVQSLPLSIGSSQDVKWGDYELLHLEPLFEPGEKVSGIELFLRNRRSIDRKELEVIAKAIWKLWPSHSVLLNVRQDAWFIVSGSFPFIYPFDEDLSIPTPAEYEKRRSNQLLVWWP